MNLGFFFKSIDGCNDELRDLKKKKKEKYIFFKNPLRCECQWVKATGNIAIVYHTSCVMHREVISRATSPSTSHSTTISSAGSGYLFNCYRAIIHLETWTNCRLETTTVVLFIYKQTLSRASVSVFICLKSWNSSSRRGKLTQRYSKAGRANKENPFSSKIIPTSLFSYESCGRW